MDPVRYRAFIYIASSKPKVYNIYLHILCLLVAWRGGRLSDHRGLIRGFDDEFRVYLFSSALPTGA